MSKNDYIFKTTTVLVHTIEKKKTIDEHILQFVTFFGLSVKENINTK